MKKNKINKIIALIVMYINALLVFKSLRLLYLYNFTDLMFGIKYGDWELLAIVLVGIIGIYKSILLYKGKFGMIPFLIATLAIWFIIFVNYNGYLIF